MQELFLNTLIEQYAENHSESEPEILQKINRETHLKQLSPRMLSGHYQGRVLSFFSQMLQAKNILEIGTFTGYATICLAEGLQENGKLISIEYNPELESTLKKNFTEAGISEKIDLKIGNAIKILPNLEETFDLVFIDADKQNYKNYYELVLPKVRKGGIILIDNVLWSGKVLGESKKDASTMAIKELNEYIKNDSRVFKIMLTIRDGITAAIKL